MEFRNVGAHNAYLNTQRDLRNHLKNDKNPFDVAKKDDILEEIKNKVDDIWHTVQRWENQEKSGIKKKGV